MNKQAAAFTECAAQPKWWSLCADSARRFRQRRYRRCRLSLARRRRRPCRKALQRSAERWRSDTQNRSRSRMLLHKRGTRARAMAENHLSNAAHTTEANDHTRLAHSPRSISQHSAAVGSTRDGHKSRSAVGPLRRKETRGGRLTTKQGQRRHSLRQARLGYRSSLRHLFPAGRMKPLLLLLP